MTPHATNTRALLAPIAEKFAAQEPLFGIEQEYTFFKEGRPHGFPVRGFPAPQGFYYCGVGADEVFGRDVVEAHLDACLTAGSRHLRHQRRGHARPVGVPGRPARPARRLRPVVGRALVALPHRRGLRHRGHARPEAGQRRLERRRRAHELLDEGDARELRPDHRRVRGAREERGRARRATTAPTSSCGSPARTRPRRGTSSATACRTGVLRCASRGRSRSTRRVTSRTAGPNANMDPYVVTRLIIDTCCSALA